MGFEIRMLIFPTQELMLESRSLSIIESIMVGTNHARSYTMSFTSRILLSPGELAKLNPT